MNEKGAKVTRTQSLPDHSLLNVMSNSFSYFLKKIKIDVGSVGLSRKLLTELYTFTNTSATSVPLG